MDTPNLTPGQQLFAALKQTTRAGQPGLVLPVGQPLAAVIRPIATVPGHTDALDVQLLTDWRNRHVKSFLTEFVSTSVRTTGWLTGAVHDEHRKQKRENAAGCERRK